MKTIGQHAGDDAEWAAGEVGGDFDGAGVWHEFEQHEVGSANGEAVDKRADHVAVVDQLALQAKAKDQGV